MRDARGRFIKGHPGFNRKPNSGWFTKGNTPWNKGKYKLAGIENEILWAWDEGKSAPRIGKEYGASRKAVEKILKAHGRNVGKRKYRAWNRGMYEIHPNLLPSEDLGFILGALQGDGYCLTGKTNHRFGP